MGWNAKTKLVAKGVLYSEDPDELLKIIDSIRNIYAPNFTSSEVKESRRLDDYHILFSIYKAKKEVGQ